MTRPRAGSLRSAIVDKFLEEVGITREQIDRGTAIWDQVSVENTDDGLEISINLKKVKIRIDTEGS